MNYTGIDCPVCGKKYEQTDDIVVCPVCGTPHHRDCWKENGKCINEEKHVEGYIWQLQGGEPANSTNTAGGKICPVCGEKNAPFEPVCTRCGERLKANRQTVHDSMPSFFPQNDGNYQARPNPNNFSPYQNVYAADARTVYGEDAAIEDVPVTEMAEYIQKDSTKYIGRFLDMQEKKTKLSWSWSAFLGSAFWCFYRKMIGVGLAVLALFFSAHLFASFVPVLVYEKYKPEVYAEYEAEVSEFNEKALTIYESDTQSMDDVFSLYADMGKLLLSPINITANIIRVAAILIINLVLGFFGNHFYKKKAVKDIHAIRQVSADSMTYHIYLRQKGNVSAANLLLPILCYMAFTMLLSYL